MEVYLQKVFQFWYQTFQPLLIIGEHYKIIGIANVALDFQLMLHKLVKWGHVHIHEQLRREVAERQTCTMRPREATNNVLEQRHDARVRNSLGQQMQENFLVNTRKELPNITLQHPAGVGVVLAHLVCKCLKALHGPVRALAQLAGEGIRNERPTEKWV